MPVMRIILMNVSKKVCQILLCFWNPWILTGMILSVWGQRTLGRAAACRRSAGAKGLCYGGRSGGEGAAFPARLKV